MITIENVEVYGWQAAIRGMRNPLNSWDKSDTTGDEFIGTNDLLLMRKLTAAGSDHSKFLRMITVTCDITAPMYWWKEFDTYKVGTVRNSCSTMHTIHKQEFTIDDFSCEHLSGTAENALQDVIKVLNLYRGIYLKLGLKADWYQMIQLLPSSYNQRATVQVNYAVLRSMYHARKNHKLDEWRLFCERLKTMPYSFLITMEDE